MTPSLHLNVENLELLIAGLSVAVPVINLMAERLSLPYPISLANTSPRASSDKTRALSRTPEVGGERRPAEQGQER